MAVCPSCNSEMNLDDDDFGMIPCPSCGVMVFVDMDGHAQVFESSSEESLQDEVLVAEPGPVQIEEQQEFDPLEPAADGEEEMREDDFFAIDSNAETGFLDVVGPSEELVVSSESHSSHEESVAGDEGYSSSDQEMEVSQDETSYSAEQSVSEELEEPDYDLDQPLGVESEPLGEVAPPDPLAEIETFGNETVPSGGILSYDLIVEGIDTAEMRTWVREALDDSRFVWGIEEIMQAIEGGRLELLELNPVKASLVVNRLRTLKVKISWRQSVVQVDN